MKKEDIDYVSDFTKYNTSFLVSLGYRLEAGVRRIDKNDDLYKIYDKDGALVLTRNNKIHHKRKDFYKFASRRHPTLRLMKARRKILHPIE